MFYKNIAFLMFCTLLCFGGVMQAANYSFDLAISDPDPTHKTEEEKPKACNKILKEAAKKQCIQKQQEEAKKKAEENTETVTMEKVVNAQAQTAKPIPAKAHDIGYDEDEELITPMFGRTLYNFIKSLML